MDTRLPELEQYVSAPPALAGDAQSRDDESRAQQAALAELADRINAARSVF